MDPEPYVGTSAEDGLVCRIARPQNHEGNQIGESVDWNTGPNRIRGVSNAGKQKSPYKVNEKFCEREALREMRYGE